MGEGWPLSCTPRTRHFAGVLVVPLVCAKKHKTMHEVVGGVRGHVGGWGGTDRTSVDWLRT
jgi:hypothetical protein